MALRIYPFIKAKGSARMYRKMLTIMAMIGLLGFASAGHTDGLQDEFMGIKWGTHISKLAHFVRTGSNGPVDYYVDPNVVYVIADASSDMFSENHLW